MGTEQFCLKWNDHKSVVLNNVDRLLHQDNFVDCTLAAEGQYLGAHKLVLSACSPYFEALLQNHRDKHPIFILKDIKFEEVKAIMSYMYRGEVIIPYDKLTELLRAAESLQVKGLGEKNTANKTELNGLPQHLPPQHTKTPIRPQQQTPPSGRSLATAEVRRNIQKNTEVVDLTDDGGPQKAMRIQKTTVVRPSPYNSNKRFARKLDYQDVIQRAVPNNMVGTSSPNAFLPQTSATVVHPSVSVPQTAQSATALQAVQTFVPSPAQYAAPHSPVTSAVVRQRPIIQQVTSLAPIHQQVPSKVQGPVVHQQQVPSTVHGTVVPQTPVSSRIALQQKLAVAAVVHRAPPVAQKIQLLPKQLPTSLEKPVQLQQVPTVQQVVQQLPIVQPVQQVQAQEQPTPSLQSSSEQGDAREESPVVGLFSENQNDNSQDNTASAGDKTSMELPTDSDISRNENNEILNISEECASEDTVGTEPATDGTRPVPKVRRGRPPQERPFKCPECDKSFSISANLEKHSRIHSDDCLKCDICDKAFTGRNALIRHLRQHKTKNSHKCMVCGMMFSSPKLLEEHLSQHAGNSSDS